MITATKRLGLRVVGFGLTKFLREWQLRRLVKRTFLKIPKLSEILTLNTLAIYSYHYKPSATRREIRDKRKNGGAILAFIDRMYCDAPVCFANGVLFSSPNIRAFAHELGHAVGLEHPYRHDCNPALDGWLCPYETIEKECREFALGNLMCPVNPAPRKISASDLRKLREWYFQ